ncbi:diguanylate cyclase [Rhodobacteraceae bacterium KMM 6894]|nr:diguanylate cyclase [Rhodobacteraceae bacterium KMM 6894]
MSGKILIVDAVATNRIVLKVKLSAAHFDVVQAPTAAEAMEMIARVQPDMIIANANLPDVAVDAFVAAIRARPDHAATPIVLLLSENTVAGRRAALQAGADDVISQPIDERIMLARMRALLRQHHMLQDMVLNAGPDRAGPDCATGFAEAQDGYGLPGRVAILAPKMADAMSLRTRLRSVCPHVVTALESSHGTGGTSVGIAPDVYVLLVPNGGTTLGLEQMAELRATPQARHSRIIAITPDGPSDLAATLLDMGANDVMPAPADMSELSLRLNAQVQRKRTLDALRDRLHDGLRAAMIDPLTGLYNRRFALPFLSDLTRRSTGRAHSFAVMVADLDHFKRINDQLGHTAGDRVLKHVADLLRRALRETDLIARIGGEEFLIVMPDTSAAEACQTADRLCRLVADAQIALRPDTAPARVTISIGLTMGQNNTARDGASVETLLDQADRALYGAKAGGRNTVTVSSLSAA